MAFAEINGFRMYYQALGEDDAPALVLIHGGLGGGDGCRDTVNRQADALSAEYRCVFYDRRACGQSDAPNVGYDMPNCARDLKGLLDYVGISRAHVLGSSAGGPIALQFGLRYPNMTASLLLINTMTYSQAAQREIRQAELRRLKERISGEGREAAAARAIAERFPNMPADEPERFARIARENLHRIDGIAATQQAYVDIGDSLEERLGELKMPALVVHGDADSRIPVECGISLSEGIPQSELRIIAGAEHGLMTNAAAGETQRIILDFLRSTAAAGAGSSAAARI